MDHAFHLLAIAPGAQEVLSSQQLHREQVQSNKETLRSQEQGGVAGALGLLSVPDWDAGPAAG